MSLPSVSAAKKYWANVNDNIASDDGFKTMLEVHTKRNAGMGPKASNRIGNSPPDLGIIVPTSA